MIHSQIHLFVHSLADSLSRSFSDPKCRRLLEKDKNTWLQCFHDAGWTTENASSL